SRARASVITSVQGQWRGGLRGGGGAGGGVWGGAGKKRGRGGGGAPPRAPPGRRGQGRPARGGRGVLADFPPALLFWGAGRGRVAQAGGASRPDAVLRAGSPAVPQFECGDRNVRRVGGEAGEPQAVGIGDPQLGPGVRSFLADDKPHPLRPALQDITGEF